MRWSESMVNAMAMNLGELQEMVRGGEAWRARTHVVAKSWT